MKSSIYKSCAQVAVFSTVEKGLSFLYRIVLSRTIGAEGVGIYQICLTVFAVFLTAASSGVPVTVSRLMAKSNAERDARGKHGAVSAGIACTLAITMPVALILFLFRDSLGFLFSDGRCIDIFLLLLPGLILTAVYSVIRGSFWGNKQFLPYSLIELLEDAVMVICGVTLVWGVTDPVEGARGATLAVLVSYIFSFALSLLWYFRTGGRIVSPKKQLKPLLASAAPITVMRTSASVLNSAVAVLLPAFLVAGGLSNSEAIAIYGAAIGMAVPMLFIPSSAIGSIAVVVAPELSENYYKGNAAAVKHDVEKSVNAAVMIATLVVPLLFALGKPLSDFLYSNDLCGEIVQTSAFVVLPMCISMMTNTVLNSMNCEKRTLLYFCIGAALELTSIAVLTRFIGVYSYFCGMALSNTTVAALNLALLKKKCRGADMFAYAVKGLAVSGAASAFGWFLVGILQGLLPTVAIIIVAAPLVLGFTCAAGYLLKMFDLSRIFNFLRRKKEKEK